ncbi:MAG: PEP-CTERM sorting domain-containing protein [Methylacidiphilales bacterium]|nr:PEP-CTERM sorting domain-containing protein [Candidatus Methylacidiphilales bacterium]
MKPFGTNNGFAGLWNLTGSPTNLPFIATSTTGTNGLTPETGGQNSYTWSFTLAQLGISPGASFNFVGIYLNAQDSFGNTFLSNEGFGNGLPNTNPGTGTATFTNFLTYTTIPEPSTYALIVGGLALLYFVVRRKATSQV